MAIGYCHVEIVKAGSGSSAVGLSSYVSRDQRTDLTTGESYSFKHKGGDLVARGMVIPDDAPEWARDGERLWNKALEAELTTDRKTKVVRFKTDAQVAKHMVLALPKECTDAERQALTEKFVQATFGGGRVAVEWAIHRPDSDRENHHAHLIVSTRRLGADGFGKKARDLNPTFATKNGKQFISEQDHWERKWLDFQNQWFRENGIDLEVDPHKVVPEKVEGKARFIPDADKLAENAARKAAAQERIADPEELLATVTERQATFSRQDLKRVLRSHGIHGAEADTVIEGALTSPEVLGLFDRASGRDVGRWTTATVRAQEEDALSFVRTIADQERSLIPGHLVHQVVRDLTMDPEQAAGLHHALGRRFSITQGDAGTGKSHTMRGMRIVWEASGLRVIGAAPTNTVAADMRKAGFTAADTLHATLGKLDRGDLRLDQRAVLLVDEAAMADSAVFHRLARHAAQSGAQLHIVGDDKQFASVARGGLYSVLRAEHGDAQLTEVRRQGEAWMRQASKDFAAGRVAAAVRAYSDHGAVAWTDTADRAQADMLAAWGQMAAQQDAGTPPFMYASTNKAVDRLNAGARLARVERGEIGPGLVFDTVRGRIEVAEGDRVQMHGNRKKDGIYNGTVGTVERIGADGSVAVRFDDGRRAVLPTGFREWGLGYAGTVYRGQGKTQPDVLALYDSPVGWNAQAAYVAGTRHKATFRMFVSRDMARDEQALVRQMSRNAFREASVVYDARSQADVARDRQEALRQAQAETQSMAGRLAPLAERLEARGEAVAAAAAAGVVHATGMFGVDWPALAPTAQALARYVADAMQRQQAVAEAVEAVRPAQPQTAPTARPASRETLGAMLARLAEHRRVTGDPESTLAQREAARRMVADIPPPARPLVGAARLDSGMPEPWRARLEAAVTAPTMLERAYALRALSADLAKTETLASRWRNDRYRLEQAVTQADQKASDASAYLDRLLRQASRDPAGDRLAIDRATRSRIEAQRATPAALVSELRGGALVGREERRQAQAAAQYLVTAALHVRETSAAAKELAHQLRHWDATPAAQTGAVAYEQSQAANVATGAAPLTASYRMNEAAEAFEQQAPAAEHQTAPVPEGYRRQVAQDQHEAAVERDYGPEMR